MIESSMRFDPSKIEEDPELSVALDAVGADRSFCAQVFAWCCYAFDKNSPLMGGMKLRLDERREKAIEMADLHDDVADLIRGWTDKVQEAVTEWFKAYDIPEFELWVSLSIKVRQMNAEVRKPINTAEMKPDDAGRMIKVHCDAANDHCELSAKLREVTHSIFSDNITVASDVKRQAIKKVTPESRYA
jgi:hypothetical protein